MFAFLYSPQFKLNTGRGNTLIEQILQCIRQISHNAQFCNRDVHMCAHFCYKTVHCGMWDWCIVKFEDIIQQDNLFLRCHENLMTKDYVMILNV